MRAGYLLTALLLTPTLTWAQECTTNAQSVADAVYRQVLERPGGRQVAPMAAALASGETTVRELMRELAKSPDHRQRFLGTNNGPNGRDAAISNLYRHLLGRQADEEGLRAHAGAFTNNNPDPIIDNMIDSPEYRMAFGDDTVPGSRVRYCGPNSRGNGRFSENGRDGRNGGSGIRFEGMDRSGDGRIERSEWNGSQASFDVHDWNRDGVLSGDEVRTGAQRGGFTPGEVDFNPASPATWNADDFRQLDRNRDGRVASNEWYYGPEFFRRADRNRDGTLSLSEFTTSAWDDDRDDRFDDLDISGNGRIERNEWHGSAEAFQWLDRNNDTVLSRAEVVGAGGEFDSFNSLDINRNGTLDVNEWRWSKRSFDRYDINRDGLLSRREFSTGGGAPGAPAR